jgi:hypothetical protein
VTPAQKLGAIHLYADALFGRGQYDRAKNMYGKVYKAAKGKERDAIAKKIIACNKGMNAPERDGL